MHVLGPPAKDWFVYHLIESRRKVTVAEFTESYVSSLHNSSSYTYI